MNTSSSGSPSSSQEGSDPIVLAGLEEVARAATARAEPCTPAYTAMRDACERFKAMITPGVFLSLLSRLKEATADAAAYAETAKAQREWKEEAEAALQAAQARIKVLEGDKARLDWLEMHDLTVRDPLVYGSRHMFFACVDDSYEGEERPSDIRAKIDLAMEEGVGLAQSHPSGDGTPPILPLDAAARLESARERVAQAAERDGEVMFAREVRAGAWDHRNDVQAALRSFR